MYPLLIVFFVVVGIQAVFFFLFLFAFSKKESKSQPPTPSLPVSVIVCAHDEETNLRELIPLLLQQDHPQFEVIIVDDRSNDSTFDLLLEKTAADHRLRMVHINHTPPHVNSKKYAVTLGIKAARYEWILLTDADCRPDGNFWINTMSSHFSDDTDFVLGFSPYLKKPGFLNMFIRFETLVTGLQYISFAMLGIPYMGVGRNLAYRRSKFLAVKGFNTMMNITGGDDDLYVNQSARRSNTATCVHQPAHIRSVPKTSWSAFFFQKIRHLSVGKHYRFVHRFLLGLFVITWMCTWFYGVPLAIILKDYYLIPTLLGLRLLLVTVTMYQATRKLGEKFEIWLVPLLDFIYAFYYLVASLWTLVTKKVRWKN